MLKKLALGDVLKGHSFSRAVENPFEFRPERTLVREGSAFPTFSATSSVVPSDVENISGFSP